MSVCSAMHNIISKGNSRQKIAMIAVEWLKLVAQCW